VNDSDKTSNASEPERLTTADLAGASGERHTRSDDPVEMVREDRDEERREAGNSASYTPSHNVPMSRPIGAGAAAAPAPAKIQSSAPVTNQADTSGPLFSTDEATNLRSRWDTIQTGFVDEPRKAVQEADSLVAEAMKRLAEQFAQERSNLEHQWDRGGDVSTEDLRIALRRYRSFFGRLLAV
jgi:hypothetical protein